ncbi:hypothetical protein [Streptomyces aidingensis]|uniref:Uncharacterized protein n=1 Tax=Streptomyces aidingensis TaxID=910347 RepID=A0A1I1V2B3_9ACTN|nr:hypothetical protein [Streptomyces aidingensis]SFD77177.1 hypothetical protein SAMN05421773_12927 [Streptomyces aidingensis]
MVLRIALGAVCTAMGLGRLVSFTEMTRILSAYQLVDGTAATASAGGCFGRCLSQSLGWPVLVQDAPTLVYAALLLRSVRTARAARAARAAGYDPGDETKEQVRAA